MRSKIEPDWKMLRLGVTIIKAAMREHPPQYITSVCEDNGLSVPFDSRLYRLLEDRLKGVNSENSKPEVLDAAIHLFIETITRHTEEHNQ